MSECRPETLRVYKVIANERSRDVVDRMIKCVGCGFNVEREQVVEWGEGPANMVVEDRTLCDRCSRCTPDVREAYRRGFNAGLDAMADSAIHTAKYSNLRKRPE